MKCPKCGTPMHERDGKFGPFKFCPNQNACGQKTITIKSIPEPSDSALEGAMRNDALYQTASGLEAELTGMASVAYRNEREHEHTRNRASVDPHDALFGGGMFCDMGMEDDDEDIRPW